MSWRDYYRVHPAADVFPMMSDKELAALGEDILENGLREPVMLLRVSKQKQIAEGAYYEPAVLLDGRNRLAAMERAGIDLNSCAVKWAYVNSSRGPFDFDAVAYVISANIHRRHLNKQQQADLIVAAIKAGEKPVQDDPVSAAELSAVLAELTKGGRGKKNPIKEKAVAAGKEHGISESTVKRAIAKAEGKTPPPVKASIAAARRHYLSMYAELDHDAQVREMNELPKEMTRLAKKEEADAA